MISWFYCIKPWKTCRSFVLCLYRTSHHIYLADAVYWKLWNSKRLLFLLFVETLKNTFFLGGDYYVRHDPCWLPVRNWYPFDASQPKLFWIVFPIEAIYSIHICLFFSLATSTIIGKNPNLDCRLKQRAFLGFLMQITSQLQYCSNRFEHVFDEVDVKQFQQIKSDFLFLIKYHRKILE